MSARPLLAAVVALSVAAPATAAPPPHSARLVPRALLADSKAAAGGDRWDAVGTMTTRTHVRAGGLEGFEDTWIDVRRGRFASRFEVGPAKGGAGFDGEKAWSQDDSGQVRLEEGADAREGAANDAYRFALAYWYPERWPARVEDGGSRKDRGRKFSVVRITPRGGRPFELWIDAATGLVDGFTERGATRLRTVRWSDYREVDGRRLPFSVRVSSGGDAKYDEQYVLEKVTFDAPLEDARFAPPPAPPPDYAIAGGRASATVPFRLVNNHIYVDVKLNGKGPYRLLCDTGGANIVTPPLAKELGLEAQGALEGRGVGEKSEDVALAKVATLELGDATLKDQLFMVFPLEKLSAVEGIPTLGLVGYEVFKRFVVTIDYAGGALTLFDPRAGRPAPRGVAVPFKFDGHTPQVEGALDGIPGTFTLDTGSRSSLSVLGPFAEKHGLAKRYGATTLAVTGWGVGGPARALLARAGRLTLGEGGGVSVERPVLDLSAQKKGAFTDRYVAGNVGGAILKRFTVTFDYGRQIVTFEPNALAKEPQAYDRSGLWLNLADGKDAFDIVDVVPGGPAAKAGLRVGERIVAVDGKPAADLALPDVRERLRTAAPGTKVPIAVEAGGKRRDVVLVLADLV